MITQFPDLSNYLTTTNWMHIFIRVLILIFIFSALWYNCRNNYFHKEYFSQCKCPMCHGSMEKMIMVFSEKSNKGDYTVYKCGCGYVSSNLAIALYAIKISFDSNNDMNKNVRYRRIKYEKNK